MEATVIPVLEGFQITISNGTPPFDVYYQDRHLIAKTTSPIILHRFDKGYNYADLYYTIIDANGNQIRVSIGETNLDRYEIGMIREILKREFLVLKKKGGFEGRVFKRKKKGMAKPCPNCRTGLKAEDILDQFIPVSSDVGSEFTTCEYCYGVGLEGGYYPPIRMLLNYFNIETVRLDGIDPIRFANLSFYGLNYPLLEKDDLIWIESFGAMFRVATVNPVTYKGIPIKQVMVLQEIEGNHPAVKLGRQIPLVITEETGFNFTETVGT